MTRILSAHDALEARCDALADVNLERPDRLVPGFHYQRHQPLNRARDVSRRRMAEQFVTNFLTILSHTYSNIHLNPQIFFGTLRWIPSQQILDACNICGSHRVVAGVEE